MQIREAIKVRYCLNCGEKIPEKAKFCPFCGENVVLDETDKQEQIIESKAEPETEDSPGPQDMVNTNFTLLDPGDEFRGYKILRMMNKDKEGIKYIAEKDGKEYVLKIFYQSSFHNMHTLFELQMRLSRLNHLKDASTAKVVEVNQSHAPAYMAVEYVHGVSLAELKKYNPERITEELVRKIALKLIQTAIVVSKHGLTVSDLTLTGIMIKDNGDPVILSSGITYEEVDEREDVFTLGTILAQLLAQNTLYKSIYSEERLKVYKFINISGVSMDMNKVLAESLHRNISQRFANLGKFYEAIKNLPSLEGAQICTVQDTSYLDENKISEDVMPKFRIEIGFWILIFAVIGLLVLIFTTNIYSVLFGTEEEKLQLTGFNWGTETTQVDSTLATNPEPVMRERDRDAVLTPWGELKSNTPEERQDPRRLPSVPQNTDVSTTPILQPSLPGENFVRIEPATFGFGRLGDNLAHNVSLSGFYISKYEVTQAEWKRFMKPANVTALGEDLPVDNVSWFDIVIYCNGLSEAEGLDPAYRIRGIGASRVVSCDFNAKGYRLPTEAEWELAAKAGQLYNYSGSNDPDEVAWFRDNSAAKLRQPGGKVPNDYGLYDMTGNVSEWVWDWYDANYIKALPTFVNPTGPDTGTQKTIRGGNVMNSEGRNLNILWRERGDPNRGYQFVGFRLVRTR
jgi:formylglycine-generating enzyme